MRLSLRALEPSDAALLYSTENDTSLWGVSGTVAPYSLHQLKEYAENYDADPFSCGQLRLVAYDSEAGGYPPVGLLDFYDISLINAHAWVGIYVCPPYRGKGIAGTLLEMGSDYARDRLGLRNLGAKILASSVISRKVFSRAGYEVRGSLPGWFFAEGKMHDVVICTLPLY